MPSRTALLITIGDVIETGPPNSHIASTTTTTTTTTTHLKRHRHRRRHRSRPNHRGNSGGSANGGGGGGSANGRRSSRSTRSPSFSHSEDSFTSATASEDDDDDESDVVFNRNSVAAEAVGSGGISTGISTAMTKTTTGSSEQCNGGGVGNNNNNGSGGGMGNSNSTHASAPAVRRLRHQSSCSEKSNGNGVSTSPPRAKRIKSTPSSARNNTNSRSHRGSGEMDEEVSFNDPLSLDSFKLDAETESRLLYNGYIDKPCPLSAKKKRKSLAEKFLEDNTDYYGIEHDDPLSTETKRKRTRSTTSEVFLSDADFEDAPPPPSAVNAANAKGGKRRTQQRVQSLSNGHDASSRQVKVNIERLRTSKSVDGINIEGDDEDDDDGEDEELDVEDDSEDDEGDSEDGDEDADDDDDGEEEEDGSDEEEGDEIEVEDVVTRKRGRASTKQPATTSRPTRRNAKQTQQQSPSPKRRRTELDKLLDAGCSSFHFETAKEFQKNNTPPKNNAATLGPIHIDVSEDASNSSLEEMVRAKMQQRGVRRPEPTKVETSEEEDDSSEEDEEEKEDDSEEEEEEEEEVARPQRQVAKRGGRGASRGRRGAAATSSSISSATLLTPKKPMAKCSGRGGYSGRRGRRGGRRPILTRADLMNGPVHIPTAKEREEALQARKANTKKMRLQKKKELRQYLPVEQLKRLNEQLRAVTCDEAEIADLNFSFEQAPVGEGWFQTYHRQDQGDEFLYFPETNWVPLPYEMPMTTFYPKKDKGPSESKSQSGTATPKEEAPVPERGSQRLRGVQPAAAKSKADVKRDLMAAAGRAAGATGVSAAALAKLGPKAAASLAEFSRKSPRCHASTKALLTGAHDEDDEDDDSEDAGASKRSPRKKFQNETVEDLVGLAKSLDAVLRDEDSELCDADSLPSPLSSGGNRHHKKKKRRRSSGASRNSTSAPEDPMDRIVASNVDAVLLDCLEEELPSNTFDEEVPGSDPMDLIREYETCNSLVLGRRFLRPKSDLSRQSSSNDLSSNSSVKTASAVRPTTAGKTVPPVGLRPTNSEEADVGSSSDFSGYSSSSSSGRKKRRKRNPTGFPSPKKTKKKTLLNNVLMKETNRKLSNEDTDADEDDSSTSADEEEPVVAVVVAKAPVRKSKKSSLSPPAKRRGARKTSPKARLAKAKAKKMTEEDGDDEEEFDERVPYRSAAFKAKVASGAIVIKPPAKRKPPRPPPPPPSKAKLAKLAAAKAAKKRLQKARQPGKQTRQSRTRLR